MFIRWVYIITPVLCANHELALYSLRLGLLRARSKPRLASKYLLGTSMIDGSGDPGPLRPPMRGLSDGTAMKFPKTVICVMWTKIFDIAKHLVVQLYTMIIK
jgi:hypothetical protein